MKKNYICSGAALDRALELFGACLIIEALQG